jgi:hypothetical protein
MVKTEDGTYGTLSNIEVYNPVPEFDRTKNWQRPVQQIAVLESVTPGDKYLLTSSWDRFLSGFTFEQVAYQNAKTIFLPTTPRTVFDPIRALNEFAPDDEPIPAIPGPDRGVYIRDVDVTHNLRLTQTGQYGMAVTIRGYIWNAANQGAFTTAFIKDGATGQPLTSTFTQYTDRQGNLSSGVSFRVANDRVKFQTLVFLPYYTLPVTASNLKLMVQMTVGNRTISTEGHRFSIDRSRTVMVPGVGKVTDNGVVPAADFSANGKIHAFFANGLFDCCIPERVKSTLGALGLSTVANGFPAALNFKGWGINTFEVEWDTRSQTTSDLANWDDRSVRRSIEEFVVAHPGDTFILFGHSFGGDTMLKVAKCLDGNQAFCQVYNRRSNQPAPRVIQLIVTDPVQAGGVRAAYSLGDVDSTSVIKNFHNYWSIRGDQAADTQLGPYFGAILDAVSLGTLRIPLNFAQSGRLLVRSPSIKQNQDEQNVARNFDGSTIYDRCGWLENCPGLRLPSCTFKKWKLSCQSGNPGQKQRRLNHSAIPEDDYIEYRIMKDLCATNSFNPLPGAQTLVAIPSPCVAGVASPQ